MNIKSWYLFILILCGFTQIFADIKSTSGTLKFDVEADDTQEMILTSQGLGIGITPSSNLHVAGNSAISGTLSIGESSGSSNLNISGTLGYSIQSVNSNSTIEGHSIVMVDSSSENIQLNLPYAANVQGRQYKVKKASTLNSVWIQGGGNMIDGTSPIELPASSLGSVSLISDGDQWYILDQINLNKTIASDNLIGWWKLNETSGNTAEDSSTSRRDGVLEEDYFFSGNSVTGKHFQALNFGGSSENHQVNLDNSDGFYDLDNYSISLWFRPTFVSNSPSANPSIISIRNGGSRRFSVHIQRDYSRLAYYNGSVYRIADTIMQNEWYHFALVSDSGTTRFYLNGEQTYTYSIQHSATALLPLIIGNSSLTTTNEAFQGNIDDVRFYNIPFTPSQISSLYDSSLP